MVTCGREDREDWSANMSGKKKDGDEGVKTLKCLRERLQAERQASRSAKLEAEIMGNKLIELEKQLKEELRLKKRAERKLVLLKRKLESLNTSTELLGSNGDYSEVEFSCCGSYTNETSNTNSSQGHEDSKDYQQKSGSKTHGEIEGDEFIDDTWALVPVSWPTVTDKPGTIEPTLISGSVGDVLRHERERLMCSLETRKKN